jgi:hypothetical protein
MTPVELDAAIAAAPWGGVIRIPAGTYGVRTIKRSGLHFLVDPGAIFSKLTFYGCSDVEWVGGRVELVATDTTKSYTPAVLVDSCQRVTLRGLQGRGSLATYTSADLDSIAGSPTGTGINVRRSSYVTIERCGLATFDKGVVLSGAVAPTVRGNDIGPTRTGMISGSAVTGPVLIESNHLHDSNPVALGGTGDHADFIHLWTNPATLAAPTVGVTIRDNLLDQGSGAAIMGIYLDDNRNGLGFRDVVIEANVILTGNNQGIRLEKTQGEISYVIMLQASGDDPRNAPGIILADDSAVSVTGSRFADPNGKWAAAGEAADNVLIKGGVQPIEALDLARYGWSIGLQPTATLISPR